VPDIVFFGNNPQQEKKDFGQGALVVCSAKTLSEESGG
jgi:hypothetical protein